MPIQKFASQAYDYKANNYTHNHILLNSSGESLSSSQYSCKNGAGSTSSNCSSNDDSPIINGSNNFYPNPHSQQTKSKHFAHDSDKACDKLTAQNNSKLTGHLSNAHLINMDSNMAVNISDTDRNKSMPDSYEKLNVLYENNSIYSTSKDNPSNTSEFNIVSSVHDYLPNHLIANTNKCKDDEKTPLLCVKTNNEMNNYQANDSFLKTHLITTSTMPSLEEGNHKSESTIIMIDEDDDANSNNKDRKLVNDFLTQSPLNLGQGYYKNGQMLNYNTTQSTSLQNSINSFMLGNNSRWDKEVKMAELSAINNRPHHNNFKSLELGMASCMGNVNEVPQQTTTAKSNHMNSKPVTDYDEQICFFDSPSTSSYHNNTFSPYDGCNLDVEMKVMNEGRSLKTFTLETCAKPGNESEILKKCSKSKKKKAITNNGENNLNILPYPMDDNLTRVAYPQKDNCPDNNSKDSKSKKAKKREKIINKNVKSQYIVKDDQGKKDINFLVAFIEGTQNSTATTTYKDYKTTSNARVKEHGRPLIPMILKDDEPGNAKQDENISSLVDSTFSVTTLVNEKAFLSSDDVDEQSHDTISETQSQISQTDRPTTTYKTMKKHFSLEDLRPHLFDPHALLFSPSPKTPLDIGTMALDDNSTRSDEDYSTPPQDFLENFQIVHKKQYRKENLVQPPQDFARNRGGSTRNAGGRPNNAPSTSSHIQFAPRLTGINSHGSKDGGRAGYLNAAPHNKSSPVAPKDLLTLKEKSLEAGKSDGQEFKPADSTVGTNEQIPEERPHPSKPGNSKTEHLPYRGDRNGRNNPRNFKGRPPYNNYRAAPSPQVEATNKDLNVVVESFNTELDFPPLVVCAKAFKNGGETMAQPETSAHNSQSTELPNPAPDQEVETLPKASSDGSEGMIESRAIEEDVKSSYASMLTKSKQHHQQLPALAVNSAAPLCKANEATTSQPTPLSNSDALKFHDSSILEVSNELCLSGLASTTTAVSSALDCPPGPSSPRVIFTYGRSNKFRHLAPNSTGGAGEYCYGEEGDEGEVKLNFTFGFDIDSPQVRDIINAKDDQNDQVAPSRQQPEPQKADQPAQPPARLLEWLEAERSKLSYLAPYFADIWAQMQKNDPSPS